MPAVYFFLVPQLGKLMGATDSNAALLSRAIAGDRISFEILLKDLHPRLVNYIEKKLPKEVAAAVDPADVVQDTLFEAWRLIRGFQPQGQDSLFRWLATIARHRMIDLSRKGKTRRIQNVDSENENGEVISLLEQLVVYRRTPSRSARAHELMASLEKSLQRLSPINRQIVVCRHIDGMSVDETAEKVGKTTREVSMLCFRGLKTLRQELKSKSRFL